MHSAPHAPLPILPRLQAHVRARLHTLARFAVTVELEPAEPRPDDEDTIPPSGPLPEEPGAYAAVEVVL